MFLIRFRLYLNLSVPECTKLHQNLRCILAYIWLIWIYVAQYDNFVTRITYHHSLKWTACSLLWSYPLEEINIIVLLLYCTVHITCFYMYADIVLLLNISNHYNIELRCGIHRSNWFKHNKNLCCKKSQQDPFGNSGGNFNTNNNSTGSTPTNTGSQNILLNSNPRPDWWENISHVCVPSCSFVPMRHGHSRQNSKE